MTLDELRSGLPDYAKDLKLNLSSLLEEEVMTPQQKYGVLVATALAARNAPLAKAAVGLAAEKLSSEALTAAKAAHAIMGMNNIYYRFTHLISNHDYRKMPAKLRMQIIARPGVEKVDFELFSLAVSSVHGCGMCVDSHEAELRKHGISTEVIQAAVRLAAVVHAIAVTLDGEAALAE